LNSDYAISKAPLRDESPYRACDLLRRLEREEMTCPCNLDAGGVGQPGHDIICNHGRHNDRVIASSKHQNGTSDLPGLRRDILAAALREPPAPGPGRGHEVVRDARGNVLCREGAPRDCAQGSLGRLAIAMGRKQAVPLGLVHRLRRGRRWGHENEAHQPRRAHGGAGERQLAAHRMAHENAAAEAKVSDQPGDLLRDPVHTVGRQWRRAAEAGQIDPQAPAGARQSPGNVGP